MIAPEYQYLTADILLLVLWSLLFVLRKDLRKPMLYMSVLVAFYGVIPQYLWWTRDWWQPITFTGTRVGLEDFLFGFACGGIATVIYEELFHRRLYTAKGVSTKPLALIILPLSLIIISVCYWFLHLTSFWSTVISYTTVGLLTLILRRDLWSVALFGGALFALVLMPFYWFGIIVWPGIIEKIWLFDYLSGIKVTGVPVEDIIFNFLLGFIIAPLYEHWQGKRLRKIALKQKTA